MKASLTICLFLLSLGSLLAQDEFFFPFQSLIGQWHGEGVGFGNGKSKIESSFSYVLGGKYIEVINQSKFEPTDSNPEGEYHEDRGFISYDRMRDQWIFRQFNIEGYVNQYVYVDSLSNSQVSVFETESIENFLPGGKARWTIKMLNDHEIETIFDVYFPDKGYTCLGTNRLRREKE